jgi:hypothetical protein
MATMMFAGTALAVLYVYPGKGVGSARTGQTYANAAKRISSRYKTVRDRRYSYTVYRTYVGRRMSNGRYPIELYSKSNRRVFRFQINSGSYPTKKGIRVGSSQKSIKSKYSSAKGPYTSGTYKRYTIKHKIYSYATYTDFYCRGGKVKFIVVRR